MPVKGYVERERFFRKHDITVFGQAKPQSDM